MATSTFNRDPLGRKLLTPASNGFDSIGRAIQAGDIDALGRKLTAKTWAISTAFLVGATMQGANGSQIEYQCTVPGTTLGSGTGPVAPGYGLTVGDGGVTWLQITTT